MQVSIGWQRFFEGWLFYEWSTRQQDYYEKYGLFDPAEDGR